MQKHKAQEVNQNGTNETITLVSQFYSRILRIMFTVENELICFVNENERIRNYGNLLKKYQDIVKSY